MFKSPWGWHTCDYATFCKLKAIRKHYWKALRLEAAWDRWDRKLPKNRVIKKKIRNAQRLVIGTEILGPQPEPNLPALGSHFLKKFEDAYQEAKQPRQEDLGLRLRLDHEEIAKVFKLIAS